ncbi:hypothetical protein ACFL24_01640 [Patescibacteria group bacterium]
MNCKRNIGGILLGALFGGLCIFLSEYCITVCNLAPLEIFYSRLLLGFLIGILGIVKINFIVRGAILGILVSLATVINDPSEILLFAGTGAVIGIIIDFILTKVKFFQPKEDLSTKKIC